MQQDNLYLFTEKSPAIRFIQVERVAFARRGPSWRESTPRSFACYTWDKQGRMVFCLENNEFIFFAYGESGRKSSCYHLDESEKTVGSEVFEYDPDNRLHRCIRRHFPTSSEQIHSYSYNDEHGITAIHSDTDIHLKRQDSHERVYREYLYNGEELQLISNYQYDEEGRIKSISLCDSSSTVHRETQYSHDEQGRLASRIVYDSRGTKISDEHYAYGEAKGSDWQERVTWIPDGKRKGARRPLEVFYRSFTPPSTETPLLRLSRETLAFSSGLYRGELKHGMPEGRGNFTFPNGRFFEGEFHNGTIEGRGSLTWPGSLTIRGYFKNGLAEGVGDCVWEDGRSYEGEFREGKMHGRGIFRWPDGNRFRGNFENGEITEDGCLEKEYPEADLNG